MCITVQRGRFIKLRDPHGKCVYIYTHIYIYAYIYVCVYIYTWAFVFLASVIWLTGFNPQSAFTPKRDHGQTVPGVAPWPKAYTFHPACTSTSHKVEVSFVQNQCQWWVLASPSGHTKRLGRLLWRASTLHVWPLRSPDAGATLCSMTSVSKGGCQCSMETGDSIWEDELWKRLGHRGWCRHPLSVPVWAAAVPSLERFQVNPEKSMTMVGQCSMRTFSMEPGCFAWMPACGAAG